jgi:hypothetical protein
MEINAFKNKFINIYLFDNCIYLIESKSLLHFLYACYSIF